MIKFSVNIDYDIKIGASSLERSREYVLSATSNFTLQLWSCHVGRDCRNASWHMAYYPHMFSTHTTNSLAQSKNSALLCSRLQSQWLSHTSMTHGSPMACNNKKPHFMDILTFYIRSWKLISLLEYRSSVSAKITLC